MVEYSVKNGIAVLTLSDPPANTYSYEMMLEIDKHVLAARMDESVHVIMLTGAGTKFFCAGANIGLLQKMTPTFKYYFCLHANETLNRLEQTPKLVIAAINGHCVGGGLEVALACDLRFAAHGEYKLGLPEVALGVLPGTGGTQRLGRTLGRAKAMELMVEGKTFTPSEAVQLGLVTKVASGQKPFMDEALEFASQFVPPNKPSMSVGLIKRAVLSGMEASFSEGLAIERELQQRLFISEDASEGLAAYHEKRKPNFKGR